MDGRLYWHYCPKCAWFCMSTSKYKVDPCKHCLDTQMIFIRVSEEDEFGFPDEEKFIESTIKTNPLYSEEAHMQREHAWQQEINSVPSSKTVCKCGSTSFSFQPRRWSLLTGVFTGNRQMRVCNSCGRTF